MAMVIDCFCSKGKESMTLVVFLTVIPTIRNEINEPNFALKYIKVMGEILVVLPP